ncbi:MAG: glycosyltransferase family 2 protein [Candidatus Woesebacteria bacterium]|jgi:glycosyltransferase involved in cell wall biosynthesis
MPSKNKTFIVIPALNEEKYLAKVLKDVSKFNRNIIYVDDGSTDQSVTIAKKFTHYILVHKINLGKGAALKTGCDYAFKYLKAENVIFVDADDQHHAEEIPLFVEALKNSKVVFGERAFDHNMPFIRILSNRLLSLAFLILFGRYIADIPSGYKAINKEAYKKLRWESTDYSVELEIAAKVAKYKIPFATVRISTIYHDFDRGMTFIDGLKTLFTLFNLRISI